MADPAPRQEVNAVIARVLSLPDVAKFEVFDALREDLAGTLNVESAENRLVRERKEALLIIKQVAEHLNLPADKAPTVKQFNAVVNDITTGWSSHRVVRLWERWGLAQSAYKGSRRINTPVSRKRRGRLRGRTKQGDARDRYFRSLKIWLDSNPKVFTIPAYEEFVEQFNADLKINEQPLSLGRTICGNIPLHWENIIAVSRGEFTFEEALDAELAEHLPAQQKDALVGLTAIARLLNRTLKKTKNLANEDKTFPVPVAYIRGHRAWLYEDLKLYKRGLVAPKRVEGELQALFIDADELLARLGMSMESLRKYIRQQRWDRIPQPEGAIVARYPYWKRDKVQAWFAAKNVAEQ